MFKVIVAESLKLSNKRLVQFLVLQLLQPPIQPSHQPPHQKGQPYAPTGQTHYWMDNLHAQVVSSFLKIGFGFSFQLFKIYIFIIKSFNWRQHFRGVMVVLTVLWLKLVGKKMKTIVKMVSQVLILLPLVFCPCSLCFLLFIDSSNE